MSPLAQQEPGIFKRDEARLSRLNGFKLVERTGNCPTTTRKNCATRGFQLLRGASHIMASCPASWAAPKHGVLRDNNAAAQSKQTSVSLVLGPYFPASSAVSGVATSVDLNATIVSMNATTLSPMQPSVFATLPLVTNSAASRSRRAARMKAVP
jgi:hypothetical protein